MAEMVVANKMLTVGSKATLECMSLESRECFTEPVIVVEVYPSGCYKVRKSNMELYRAWPREPRNHVKSTDLICGWLAPGDPQQPTRKELEMEEERLP